MFVSYSSSASCILGCYIAHTGMTSGRWEERIGRITSSSSHDLGNSGAVMPGNHCKIPKFVQEGPTQSKSEAVCLLCGVLCID